MGYENRDYAQDYIGGGWGYSSNSGGGFKNWEIWKKLIALNIGIFLLQIFITRPATIEDLSGFNRFEEAELAELAEFEEFGGVSEFDNLPIPVRNFGTVSTVQKWFELDSQKFLKGQVWRVVTCGFCHDRNSIWHLLMNMLFLYWFGSRLEYRYGSKEFAAFYFVSLLISSLFYIGLDLYTKTMVPAIGASGAIWGVVALYALHYPYETIRINFLFPIQIRYMALIYFLFDLHPVLLALSGDRIFSGVGHAAHVGGVVFGFVYWRYGWQLTPLVDRFTGQKPRWANAKPRSNAQARVIPMNGPFKKFAEEDSAKMDSILEKISSHGRESLTEHEEKFLLEQSNRIRNR